MKTYNDSMECVIHSYSNLRNKCPPIIKFRTISTKIANSSENVSNSSLWHSAYPSTWPHHSNDYPIYFAGHCNDFFHLKRPLALRTHYPRPSPIIKQKIKKFIAEMFFIFLLMLNLRIIWLCNIVRIIVELILRMFIHGVVTKIHAMINFLMVLKWLYPYFREWVPFILFVYVFLSFNLD